MKYSKKRREAVLKKMMAPHNRSIKELALEEGITETTLYNGRKKARQQGLLLPVKIFFPQFHLTQEILQRFTHRRSGRYL